MYISHTRRTFVAVCACFVVFLLACAARLFYIQFFRSRHLSSLAEKQHNLFVELEARRGTIYDCRLRPQAVNISADSLFACPKEIEDSQKEKIIRALMPVLGLEYDYLKDRLSRKKSFIWISRKLDPQKSEAVKRLNLKGLGFIKESKRCYPNGYLASHIIGFAGLDNVGLEGIEYYYDKYLKGESGWACMLRDARQRKLDLFEEMVLPRDGYDVVLTIDEVIQYIAERELDAVFRHYRAKAAMIVVMDPHTGAVLAMANRPSYDMNQSFKNANEIRRNRSVCDLFEPGSIFKIVTASAALEEKKVSEEDKFFCENGSYRVANHILHDHRPHGWLTFSEVIQLSSNIGTTKVAELLGPATVYHYAKMFGFGAKTGVDLPGEIAGMLKDPKYWSKTSIGAIPIGHEVGVSALQLASAISVIANGGQLMHPFVVSQIRDRFGEVIRDFSPRMLSKVVSVDTTNRMKNILRGVIENGTGKLAALKEYSAAGKTGTAQKIEENGTYSHSKYVASFIGFAPVEDPLIAIAVIVDEPRPYYYGGVVAAPVFKNVARDVIKYLKSSSITERLVAYNEGK